MTHFSGTPGKGQSWQCVGSGFVMKGADCKSRLDQRQARIPAAAGRLEDDDETEQEKLECEAKELTSQLKRAERAKSQARDKEERKG